MAKCKMKEKTYEINLENYEFKIGDLNLDLLYAAVVCKSKTDTILSELFQQEPGFLNTLTLRFKIEKGPKPVVDKLYIGKGYWVPAVEVELTEKEAAFFQKLLDSKESLKDYYSIKRIESDIRKVLKLSVSEDYVEYLLDNYDEETERTFLETVVDDVMTSSDWETTGEYNMDDIRLAIGREFINRLGE